MKRRFLAIFMLLILLLVAAPQSLAADQSEQIPDMAAIDQVYAEILAMRQAPRLINKAASAVQERIFAQKAARIVQASDTYVAGSLQWRGNGSFSWQTTEGVPCRYVPEIYRNREDTPQTVEASVIVTEEFLQQNGFRRLRPNVYTYEKTAASASAIYLYGPYYGGYDEAFTDLYLQHAICLAEAGNCSLIVTMDTAVDLDAIAYGMTNGKMVMIDSHGGTDYYDTITPYLGEPEEQFGAYYYKYLYDSQNNPALQNDDGFYTDSISQANTSYINIQSMDGWTSQDKQQVVGTYSSYSHVFYDGYSVYEGANQKKMYFYSVDGTAIANHMSNAPEEPNFAWIGCCEGMATDGLAQPLLDKGVDGIYGYSRSVTFYGDSLYLKDFVDGITNGKTVAESLAAAKENNGNWDTWLRVYYLREERNGRQYYDYADQASDWTGVCYPTTLKMAQRDNAAFPVCVSETDPYPENPSGLQEVHCDWRLVSSTITDRAAAKSVEDQIAALGEVELDSADAIAAARRAYEALSEAQKALVPNLTVLEQAEQTLTALQKQQQDRAAAKSVEDQIAALGEVELDSADAIAAARRAYEALSEAQKALVPNLTVLEQAEQTLTALQKQQRDRAAAKSVEDQIAALGEVELDSADAIAAARADYEALSEAQKALVPNLTVLEQAEQTLAALQKQQQDRAAAKSVEDQIAALGKVELDSADAIAAVRAAYEALSEAQKALVPNLTVLEQAEQTLAALQKQQQDRAAAKSVEDQIAALGEVELDSVDAIAAARRAYEALSEAQKALVPNLTVLEQAEQTLTALKKWAAFLDLKAGAYYEDAVRWAVLHGITDGVTPTTFVPDGVCTRGQIVTFLWRAKKEPKTETTAHSFLDVQKGAYYYDAVCWAVEEGITTGMTATTFSPNAPCTRAQAVTFLWRAAGRPAPRTSNGFTDVKQGTFYYDAVCWAVEEGITTGMTATAFCPNALCTRAQAVTFLRRAAGGSAPRT